MSRPTSMLPSPFSNLPSMGDESIDFASAVLMVGLDGLSLSRGEEDFLRTVRPAGVILFGRNINQAHHNQVLELTQAIQNTCAINLLGPMLIAIDQEGGRVARLKADFPNQGPAFTLADGKADRTALSEIQQYGERVGVRLRELGINVNFAPVVDLLTEPRNTAIGDRCFGQTPEAVSARAGAFLAGIQSQGIWGCLKHFPGQGHAYIDTHLGQAVVDLPLNVLENRELLPFIHLKDQAAMIMVAHCIYPNWSKLEASRSPEIMNDLLRTKLGFNGLIVTDDMLMGAIPQTEQEWSQAIVDSVAAGADLVLVCKDLSRAQLAYSALKEAESRSTAFKQRLAQAALKVQSLRRPA